MIRRVLHRFALCGLLISAATASVLAQGSELNQPAPRAAQLVRQAIVLAEADKPLAALVAVRRARLISPNYLRAHIAYREIKTNYLDQYDAVEAEYGSLLRRFPNNAVYLMALNYRANGPLDRDALNRIVRLAPDWAWAHYARALLAKSSDPGLAVIELQRCTHLDKEAIEAYELLIDIQEKRLDRIDDAIKTAQEFAAQVEIRPSTRLPELWRLRLLKANGSESAKNDLKNDLVQLANQTNDLDVLVAIRSAYLNLVPDSEALRSVENRMRRIDPSWTPQRGWVYSEVRFNESRVPRIINLVNRQIKIREDVQQIVGAVQESPVERIDQLERLLTQRPTIALKRIIYESIFRLAYRSHDSTTAGRYGSVLFRMDRSDAALAAQIALVLADDSRQAQAALYFARAAFRLTSQFHRAERSKNTPRFTFDGLFPLEKQQEAFKKNRALALDAYGWILVKMKEPEKAESLLREAVSLDRTADRLWHLAKALEKLGRDREAAVAETESSRFLSESLRRSFTDSAAPDARFMTIDGRPMVISDLKGKVVIINFWATWCVPCIQEMPSLKRIYDKYRTRGLEVLAVSTDEDAASVAPFVKNNDLPFPVLHDQSFSKQLGVDALPTNLFLDQKGHIRYRKTGFVEGDERELEAVVLELLK
jgi:peroxiredoxin/tetratricopeptide (TPR) repeat protein